MTTFRASAALPHVLDHRLASEGEERLPGEAGRGKTRGNDDGNLSWHPNRIE